jgi:restriction endonuclease S subunit
LSQAPSTVIETSQAITDRGPLPKNWRWLRLGDLCKRSGQYGTSQKADSTVSGGLPVLGMSNIHEGRIRWDNLRYVSLPSSEVEKYRLAKGDILFNRTNSAELVGKTAVFDGSREAIFASYLIRLQVNEAVANPNFLAAYINSEGGRRFIETRMARAIGQVNISASTIMTMPIPLPPITDQKRIAAILNEQMAAVERARAAAEVQLESAKDLPASYLREVFESPEAQQWTSVKLGELLRLRKEIVHPRDNPKGTATFVGLEHIESLTGRRVGAVQVDMAKLTGRKPQFNKGDIVYGYLRPYLNKLWVAEFDGLCSVDQYVYTVDSSRALTEFVAWFMRSSTYLDRAPIDTTPGQLPRIRTEEVVSVEINLPSLQEQHHIASMITEQNEASQQVRKSLQDQLDAINEFPVTLLRQAFTGQL